MGNDEAPSPKAEQWIQSEQVKQLKYYNCIIVHVDFCSNFSFLFTIKRTYFMYFIGAVLPRQPSFLSFFLPSSFPFLFTIQKPQTYFTTNNNINKCKGWWPYFYKSIKSRCKTYQKMYVSFLYYFVFYNAIYQKKIWHFWGWFTYLTRK